MTSVQPYSMLADVPAGVCLCRRGRRFYVALSRDLNLRVFERSDGLLVPFVFKVGTTKICRDRIRSLNEFRQERVDESAGIYAEPAYAGATDWKILLCREVATDRYDDVVFKRWLRSTHDAADIRSVSECSFTDVEGLDPRRTFRDLCIMSEDFVRRRKAVRANHPLHDDMLGAVAEVLVSIGGDFLRIVSARSAT